MPDRGKIKRVFPGGNTSLGFYSLYDYVLPQDEAQRIFVIKGGPGVGKSTFMTKISEELLKRGIDVEYLQCSSDNDSIDGVFIPSVKVALIDGTAPHVVDPKNPCVIDEIINLGDYWDESKILPYRDEVYNTNKRTSKLFNIAYSLLKEARVAYDEWKGYIKDGVDKAKYNKLQSCLLTNIFAGVGANYGTAPKQRHLFASAITPGGIKNYIDTIIDPGMNIHAIEGEPGSGVKELIARVAQQAVELGLFTEQYHCPFEPDYLDMVLIPSINTVVLNTSQPFHYDVLKITNIKFKDRINLNVCINNENLKEYESEIQDAKDRFYSLIANAVSHLSKAKSVHDAMEHYYVSAMNFDKINEKRQEVLARILKYAGL